MAKIYPQAGYFLDLFFLQKPFEVMDNAIFLSCLQTALSHVGLRVDNTVTKKEFSSRTRSVPVNRYVRIPRGFLSKYDERATARSSLDVITFDPTKKDTLEGIRLESDVHFDNTYFHDSRYISAHLLKLQIQADDGVLIDYMIVKVSYNFKLMKAFPKIVDINGYLGIYLTRAYSCSGLYTRAGSFARSEELAINFHNGEEKDKLEGADTCINYVNATSKVADRYGIDCRKIIDYMDDCMSILYAPDDLIEIETARKKHFERYKMDRPEVYTKLDAILGDWYKKSRAMKDTPARIKPVVGVVRQMLEREADLSAVMIAPEEAEGKASEANLGTLDRIVDDLSRLLVSHVTIKNNLYREAPVREFYLKLERINSSASS